MKRSIFVFLALFIMSVPVFSQGKKADVPVKKDASEITFKEVTHDYGLLPYKGDGTCEFTFKNTGKEPLVLTNVKSSCGCTIPTWPRDPIAKKGKGSIKVKYDTKRQGKFNKTITVYSNASNSPVRLTIRGEVTKPSKEEMEEIRMEREKRAEQRRKRQQNVKPKQKTGTQSLKKQKSILEVR